MLFSCVANFDTNFIFCDEYNLSTQKAEEAEVKDMVRLCILCESWESGGIESFLCNTLLAMDRSGLEVDIVAAQIRDSVFTAPLEAAGIHFRELSGALRSPKNGPLFSALLAQRHYDVVHLNAYQGLSLHYLALAQKAGVPVRIAHSHGIGLRNSLGKPLKLLLHRLGKRLWSGSATERLACSQPAAKFLFPQGQSYRWIPNGIDVERFRFQETARKEQRQALGLTEDQLLVGTVGRLSEEKNHQFLLDVFCQLQTIRRDSVLLLVGAGRLEEQLRARAEALGIASKVIFYGPSDHVEQLLWAMDVFAFPSHMEGLGIAAVEAQAAGLPVVCSEGVPWEALATDLTRRLPLSAGAKGWAETLLKEKAPADRVAAADAVSAAGFDVSAVAREIRDLWVR